MSKDIIREWNFWLASLLTGACMAFLYDILRLFRRLVRHNRLAVDLEDIAYWFVCFGASFVLLYYGNNGIIRFAAVVGAAAGMAAYALTLGRIFVRICYFVIERTVGSALRLLRRLFCPVRAAVVKLHQKKLVFYQKCRLTCTAFRRKIYSRRKNAKGETGHVKAEKQKKNEDTKIYAHKK